MINGMGWDRLSGTGVNINFIVNFNPPTSIYINFKIYFNFTFNFNCRCSVRDDPPV